MLLKGRMEAERLSCCHVGEMVEVGGGSRWKRKASFALENTWVVKLTQLSTCQMERVREMSR